MDRLRVDPFRAAARLLAALSAIEAAVAAWTVASGPFAFDVAGIRVSASDPLKPTLIAAVGGSLAAWLWSRARDAKPGEQNRSAWLHPVAAVSLAALSMAIAVAPLFHAGFPAGHDVRAHLTYTYLFDEAFRQGQIPVRWVEVGVPGRGQPLFNYYQVGLYYFVEAVHALVPSLSLSLKATVAGLWWLGAVFVFLLFKRLGLWPGVVASLVFALSPYLLLDVYVRAAYPEVAAIAMAAGTWWSLDGCLRSGRPGYLLAFALLLGLTLITHLPTVAIVGLPMLLYMAYLGVTHQTTVRRMVAVVPAGILGLGIAAFYLWPALAELHLIAIHRMTAGGFDFHQHFVYPRQWLDHRWGVGASIPGPNDRMSFQIGVVQECCLAGAILAVSVPRLARRAGETARELAWWLSVVALGLFMMTDAALFAWNALRPLAFIQYPWRFLILPAVGCGGLAAGLVAPVRNRSWQALIVACAAVALWNVSYEARRTARDVPRTALHIDNPRWRETAEARADPFIEAGYDPLGAHQDPSPAVGRWTITRGQGTVVGQFVTDDRLQLEATSRQGLQLVLNSRDFPTWRVWVDGLERPVAAQPGTLYLQIEVPPGVHEIAAALDNTPVRTRANRLTLASVLVWGVGGLLVIGSELTSRRRRPG